jgi:hypothetical protein
MAAPRRSTEISEARGLFTERRYCTEIGTVLLPGSQFAEAGVARA